MRMCLTPSAVDMQFACSWLSQCAALQVTTHQSYGEKCDIFALGCLMYDLHTRQLRHVNLFASVPLGTSDADVLGQYAIKV